jgi:hypothetical protein
MKEGRSPVQTTWLANQLLAAATTFTVVILGQDHYVEAQMHPLEADTRQHEYRAGFPEQQMIWLAENIFSVIDCLETLITRGNHSAEVANQLLKRLCMTQGDLRKLYRLRFDKIVESGMQQYQQQHNQSDISAPQIGYSKPEVNVFHSLSTSTTPSTHLSPDLMPSAHLQVLPMSAASLLDAVLSDPTELGFLGHTQNTNLLADLLKDSPPM